MKPSWCAKQSPCDFDESTSYCLHRECRARLISENMRLQKLLDSRDKRIAQLVSWRDEHKAAVSGRQE